MALLYVEGGKEEQTCPRAVATPQDPAVMLLARNLDKPCEISHPPHPAGLLLVPADPAGSQQSWGPQNRAVAGSQQAAMLASRGKVRHASSRLRCAVRRRLLHRAKHHPAPCLGTVSQASYATEEITAEAETNQLKRQSVVLISNPAVKRSIKK